MKLLGLFARSVLTTVIVFQLSIGHALASSGDGGRTSSQTGYPQVDHYTARLLKAADQLDNETFFKENSPKQLDVFRFSGQRVEIYNGARDSKLVQTINLDDHRIEKPILAYTSMKPRYNKTTRELVFEASRGAQVDGTGGTVVARHIIPNVDIVGMNHDNEMLMFLDSKGKLHAIDMGYVLTQVFQNPIPTFRNLWEAPTDMNLRAGDVRLEFITRGVQPPNLNPNESVVPKNAQGEMVFNAGDLLVRYKEGSQEKVLGVFSRQVSYDRIREGSALLASLASLITPDQKIIEFYNQNENKFEELIQLRAAKIEAANGFFQPLQNVDITQLKTLAGRLGAIENDYKSAPVDKFTINEWVKDYEELKRTASDSERLAYFSKRAKHLQETAAGDDAKKLYREGYNQFLADAEAFKRLQAPEGLAHGWQLLTDQVPRNDPFAKATNKPVKEKRESTDRQTEWKIISVVGAATAAYISGAFLYTGIESLQQIQLISWLYEHIYPSVMKDAIYRIPLSKSVIAWIGVIPAALSTSMFFGKVVDILANSSKTKDTAMALFLRDFQKVWGFFNEGHAKDRERGYESILIHRVSIFESLY